MRYKGDIFSLLTIAFIVWFGVWPVFASDFTPSQIILSVLFSYLGVRLCYFVYFQKKNGIS